MLQNFFDDIEQEESYTITEPVTLAEAKAQCIVTYTEDDDYFTNVLIPACRAILENYCHISLVEKTVTATLRIENNITTRFPSGYCNPQDQDNVIELPYGPVKEDPAVTQISPNGAISSLTENEEYSLTGSLYKNIILNTTGTFLLVYKTGYQNAIPRDLKLAILNEIAFRYDKRGDETKRYAADTPGVCAAAQVLADKYRRVAWH